MLRTRAGSQGADSATSWRGLAASSALGSCPFPDGPWYERRLAQVGRAGWLGWAAMNEASRSDDRGQGGRGASRGKGGGAKGSGQGGKGQGGKGQGGKGQGSNRGRGGKPGQDDPAAQLKGPLEKVLARLPETQRKVLELRMGLADGHPHDLSDTARALGLSMSEARDIERRAFEHIREAVPLQQLQRFLER